VGPTTISYIAFFLRLLFYALTQQKNFFANIGSICLFAMIGTLICGVGIGVLLWMFCSQGWVNGSTDFIECMMFGALLSATDPVATLALFQELNVDPQLYSLVFGESIINDAVSIVFFR
jgi:sodium/hydrogen exchanger-like protein 6/7